VNIIKAHVNPDGGRPAVIVSAFPPNRLGVLANQGIIYYNGLLKGQLTGVDLFFSDNFDDLYDSTSGDAKPGLMSDTVHPNDAGYTLIAENWNTALVQVMGDIAARTHGLGWLREDIPADARVTPVVAAALPTHFDWRQKDGYNWMTSVKNQASCGSCVAFAAVGATEGQLRIQAYNPSWGVDLSEQHLFSCGGGSCSYGWYISSALNYLRNYGTPDESCSPYRAQSGQASCSNSCSDWQSRAFKISSWNWISSSPSAIEAALMNGPLVAAFDVYTDFFYYNGGVYHYTWGSLEGGHAIVIVGYDSNEQYWIVKNSWGNWGEGGYFRIGFGEVGIEQEVASIRASTVTATVTAALTRTSTSYAYGTTTRTSTSYTSTSTTTSTIPTVATVVLVPLTVTSTMQSIQYLTSILTTTVTSYSSTEASTSTIPTVTTVVLVPLAVTSMVQSIQYLTSILTTTVTSYTGTETSTSTIVVPTTVTMGPSTSTVETTQVLTSTGTTMVTGYTTTTVTSYTGTETSTSTSVVYTTVTILQGPSPFPSASLPGVSIGTLPAGYETSGLAWHSRLQKLLTVSDGGTVSSMNTDGSGLVNWSVPGDLEGICVANAQSDYVYIGVEHPDSILEFNIRTGTVTRTFDLTAWMTGADNQGLEGLTFVPSSDSAEGGVFYAGLQADGRIYLFELPIVSSSTSTNVTFKGTITLEAGLADIADLSYDDESGVLLSVFDGPNRLKATTRTGQLLQEWQLPGTEQEGILFHNGALYVGEDYGGASTGRVIRYAPFSLPVITPPTPPVNPGDTRVITSAIDTQLTNFQNQRANLGGASELQFSTTVTILAGAGASSPLAYLGFICLLGVMAGRRVTFGKGWRVRRVASHR